MNDFLIDNTREHLIGAAAYAAEKEEGDLRVQILAREAHVMIRVCLGGTRKVWHELAQDWEELARARTNPLLAVIDGLIFRAERTA